MKPIAEYDQGIVRTGDLIIKGKEYLPKGSDVCDMSIKGFRKILRRKGKTVCCIHELSGKGVRQIRKVYVGF